MATKKLTPLQHRGLLKTGDILIPGDSDMPSFSRTGCAAFVDAIVESMSKKDRDGFLTLMAVFGILPGFIVHGILALTSRARGLPGVLGAPFRMLELGVKGVVMSLYYSDLHDTRYDGKPVFEIIRYDVRVRG